MYPLGGGNPYKKNTSCQNTSRQKTSIQKTSNTRGTYLNKLDKFAQYKNREQQKREKKNSISKLLKEMNLDFQNKKTLQNPLNSYDSSPKLLRQPLNNYLKKSENEKLKETILDLKTEIIELKIENHTLRSAQTKHQHFMDDLEILMRQNV